MKLSLISYFSRARRYYQRTLDQFDSLQQLLNKEGHHLSLVLGYGDSPSGFGGLLHEACSYRFDCQLIDVSHGGKLYGSVVDEQRFKQLAYIANKLWSAIPKDSDYAGLVESDLIWEAEVFKKLVQDIDYLSEECIVAPMVMKGETFYDTWAFRANGEQFAPAHLYHPSWTSSGFVDMDSVGSCLLMHYRLAKKLKFPEKDVVVGFCNSARQKGARVYLDPVLKVEHP